MLTDDRLAKLVWDRYVDRVARGLAVVINTLNPDIVVLGGGMANIDELYSDLVPEAGGRNILTVLLHSDSPCNPR